MSNFSRLAASAASPGFALYGEAVVWVPKTGPAFDAKVIERRDLAEGFQPEAPGFFAVVEVNPAEIALPLAGDQVGWSDGTFYVVARVTRNAGENPLLYLHRRIR
jgi:hypothetical protein